MALIGSIGADQGHFALSLESQEEGTPKVFEPPDEEVEVEAGGGEDCVDAIAAATLE
ncbi:hypothetical protein UCD39_25840 [Nitrospirillum sp. BR 11752]|nr:hypothetical protein [Nitrospirillum sp. BR 11752]